MEDDDHQQLVAAARVAPRRPMMFRVPRRLVASRAVGGASPPVRAAAAPRKKKKKMAVARLGGKRRLFGAIRRLRSPDAVASHAVHAHATAAARLYYATAINDLLEGAAVIASLRGSPAGAADCAFGTAFVPVVTVAL